MYRSKPRLNLGQAMAPAKLQPWKHFFAISKDSLRTPSLRGSVWSGRSRSGPAFLSMRVNRRSGNFVFWRGHKVLSGGSQPNSIPRRFSKLFARKIKSFSILFYTSCPLGPGEALPNAPPKYPEMLQPDLPGTNEGQSTTPHDLSKVSKKALAGTVVSSFMHSVLKVGIRLKIKKIKSSC